MARASAKLRLRAAAVPAAMLGMAGAATSAGGCGLVQAELVIVMVVVWAMTANGASRIQTLVKAAGLPIPPILQPV